MPGKANKLNAQIQTTSVEAGARPESLLETILASQRLRAGSQERRYKSLLKELLS